MDALLLIGLTESELHALGDLPVEARTWTVATDRSDDPGLADALDGVVAVVVGGPSPPDILSRVQQVHRRDGQVRLGVLLPEAQDAEWRTLVRFAPGVPVDLEVLHTDDPELSTRVRSLHRAAAQERVNARTLAGVGDRQPGAAPDVVRTTLGALLEHAPLGVLVADTDQRLLAWNPAAAELLDLESRAAGVHVADVFPAAQGVRTVVSAALASDSSEPGPVHTMKGPDGSHLDVRAALSLLNDGRRVVLVLVQDATVRVRALHERDRLAAQVDMIGRVSEALLGAQESYEALELVAAQVVPLLADWVEMQVYDERGVTTRVVARHHDRTFAELTARVEQAMPHGMSEDSPSRRIARGEGPLLLPEITSEMLADFIPDRELRTFLTHLGVGSAIAVPLSGRTSVLGSLVLLKRADSAPLGHQELVLALEVGRRVGMALETLQQHGRQRALAEALQRSMLTEPPETAHAQVVVRYRPAADEAQVGGDWYDSYLQDDGSFVVSIGDVVGHDFRAAAAMGQLRGLLRGIGYASGLTPAAMLRSLDAAIAGLLSGITASAVVAEVAPPEPDATGGRRSRVRWSNAGHPPPVLVPAGGRPEVLATGTADLILGVLADTERTERSAELGPGDTLVLYSDGLIERRDRDMDEGLDDLVAALTDLQGLPLDEMCDRLLNRMLPAEQEDDVALLAIRVIG